MEQIDKVIPLPMRAAAIDAINKEIPAWATANSKPESPIAIADCSSQNGFTAAMLRDGVHPGPSGDKKMAQEISPLLIKFVQDAVAGK